jgi:hypothetical protein
MTRNRTRIETTGSRRRRGRGQVARKRAHGASGSSSCKAVGVLLHMVLLGTVEAEESDNDTRSTLKPSTNIRS